MPEIVKEEPGKDTSSERVNFDNMDKKKFDKEFKRRRRGKKDPKEKKSSKTMNDFAWYNKFPSLIEAAARVPFGNLVGEFERSMGVRAVPGIYTMGWSPTIGGAWNSSTSTFQSVGINQAAESRYSYVVHANSRNQDYDAADLQIVSVAGASVFSMLAYGIRAYGTMQHFSPTNKYLPDALLRASGFNVEDLRANYSHMWFDLNQRIARANQIWIPKDQPILQRWFWMNSAYYKDSMGEKAQIYLFRPNTYLQYSEAQYETGPAVVRKAIGSTPLTWSAYLTIVDDMLTALLDSLDRGTMYGDVLKAYGESNLFAINELKLEYTAPIVFEKEVLMQIENSICFGANSYASTGELGDIIQTEGTIIQRWIGNNQNNGIPGAQANPYSSPGTSLLNFHNIENPSIIDVTIATRLKPATAVYARLLQPTGALSPAQTTETKDIIIPRSFGTELIVTANIWRYEYSNNVGPTGKNIVNINVRYWNANNNAYAQLEALQAFDWAPWMYEHQAVASTGLTPSATAITGDAYQYTGLYGDWDNYTFIDDETLTRLHLACELSLWGMKVL